MPASIEQKNPHDPRYKPPNCRENQGVVRILRWRAAKLAPRPGHPELVQGVNRKEPRPHGTVTVTRYVCDRCSTVWDYENNKVNLHAGWSVVG